MANKIAIKLNTSGIFAGLKFASRNYGPILPDKCLRAEVLRMSFSSTSSNPIQGNNMPVKKPLCNYGGVIREIADTDTLPGLGALVSKEIPSGTKNGVNTSFTLAYTPTPYSEMVFVNGALMNYGNDKDYTVSSNTIIFVTPPASDDIILVTYWK